MFLSGSPSMRYNYMVLGPSFPPAKIHQNSFINKLILLFATKCRVIQYKNICKHLASRNSHNLPP